MERLGLTAADFASAKMDVKMVRLVAGTGS
jgi:hypothetical protein